jgi:polygalacturonase
VCVALLSQAAVGQTQDSRTVAEPRVPSVCRAVAARLVAVDGGVAAADEAALDTSRIQSAIDACRSGTAVELRPEGDRTIVLSGPLQLKRGITLVVARGVTLFASRNPRDFDVSPGSCGIVDQSGRGCRPLIHVAEDGAAVMGEGVIDGRGGSQLIGSGNSWWDLAEDARKGGHQNCPRLIVADHVNDFTLYRITLKNSPNFHVVFSGGHGFTAWGVVIDTPKTARNTDGIDPISATDVSIVHCSIHAGDDNVAIKAGSGGPASNVTVAHNRFLTGHGMSIGSETDGGVRHVRVLDLSIDGADNGLRIKSNSTRGGLVNDVVYEDVCIRATKNPIVLDTTYSSPDSSGEGVKIPIYTDIAYRNVRIEGPGNLQLEGHDATHRLRVTFTDVHATSDVKTRSKEIDLSGALNMDGDLTGCGSRFAPKIDAATAQLSDAQLTKTMAGGSRPR